MSRTAKTKNELEAEIVEAAISYVRGAYYCESTECAAAMLADQCGLDDAVFDLLKFRDGHQIPLD